MQVSAVCLLLLMTTTLHSEAAPTVNCMGCTPAAGLETLVKCSASADSVCGKKRADEVLPSQEPTETANVPTFTSTLPSTSTLDPTPEMERNRALIITTGVILVFAVLLFGSVLTLLSCRRPCYNKLKGNPKLTPTVLLVENFLEPDTGVGQTLRGTLKFPKVRYRGTAAPAESDPYLDRCCSPVDPQTWSVQTEGDLLVKFLSSQFDAV
ncbi:uncharacterized protein LOC114919613 isoform X2 [Xyrichtys novacula]|uniref:Uncharacterized protein LOC114919613 isoform X2 n=1 Tax=Xyrichtys novacula TaxID=13765 RepID=A0AAV1EHZ0_XYRNO|nr:uncharacterized protein LOC114919613 isoform X2 [Xyrichtys novacula]